jgi:hypothetical protein
MSPRSQWALLILLAMCAAGYATYASRKSGPCSFVHTGVCVPRSPRSYTN